MHHRGGSHPRPNIGRTGGEVPEFRVKGKIEMGFQGGIYVIDNFKSLLQRVNQSGRLTPSEISYINAVYNNMTTECTKDLNDLIAVTTDGTLQMTDDERIRRIDGIYLDMSDKYAFTQSFVGKTAGLMDQRDNDMSDTDIFKALE